MRVALAVPLLLLLSGTACGDAADRVTTVRITAHFSRFVPDVVHVERGQAIRFVLTNDDPIDHEWIVGDQALQDRHEKGTEPRHDSRPTEVTIDASTTRTTTVRFDTAGTLEFACHLPGHYAYGMRGRVEIS